MVVGRQSIRSLCASMKIEILSVKLQSGIVHFLLNPPSQGCNCETDQSVISSYGISCILGVE